MQEGLFSGVTGSECSCFFCSSLTPKTLGKMQPVRGTFLSTGRFNPSGCNLAMVCTGHGAVGNVGQDMWEDHESILVSAGQHAGRV